MSGLPRSGLFDSPAWLRRSSERTPPKKNPTIAGGVSRTAPRVGLEPTTLRLRYSPSLSTWPGLSLHPEQVPSSGTSRRSRALSRLIGKNPHPLVSARSPLHTSFFSRGFAQDYHLSSSERKASLNSPDVSIPITRESCYSCMKFSVTVCTHQDALVELLFHFLPASCVSFRGDPKAF